MIICWSVPLGAGRTSEQRLERDRRTKFGASEEPQHTTHTQGAQRHGNTHTRAYKWGEQRQQMENYFGHVEHGSRTRLHVLWGWKVLMILSRGEQALQFLASFLHAHLAKYHKMVDYAKMSWESTAIFCWAAVINTTNTGRLNLSYQTSYCKCQKLWHTLKKGQAQNRSESFEPLCLLQMSICLVSPLCVCVCEVYQRQ